MEMEIITKIQSLNIKSEINSSFNFFQQLDGFIKNFWDYFCIHLHLNTLMEMGNNYNFFLLLV